MIAEKIQNQFQKLIQFTKKYKKLLIALALAYAFWFFGLGFLGGFLLSKGTLASFPEIKAEDRVLIIAPHIDDEVISSGGLIQQAITKGAQVKVIYMTNGDGSTSAIIGEEKNLKLTPNEFVDLGEKRMKEAEAATAVLGLRKESLIFLGYPDGGLYSMLNSNYSDPYTSKATHFNYNSYKGTFREKQTYSGTNVVEDLQKIMRDFGPNIVVLPHSRDKHLDHRATFYFFEKATPEGNEKRNIYAYLVHYSLYPPEKKALTNQFLYPPSNLFSKDGWFSYDLDSDQQDKKMSAIDKNISQLKMLNGFLKSFVRKNEIFELMR